MIETSRAALLGTTPNTFPAGLNESYLPAEVSAAGISGGSQSAPVRSVTSEQCEPCLYLTTAGETYAHALGLLLIIVCRAGFLGSN